VPEYVGSDPSKFLLIKGNESSQIHGTNVALQLGENFKNDLERLSSLMSI